MVDASICSHREQRFYRHFRFYVFVTGANFRANCLASGRGGADEFGEMRDLGAGQAQARA